MPHRLSRRWLAAFLALALSVPALAQDAQARESEAPPAGDDLLTTAAATPGLSYFVALLGTAGLADLLQVDGPFTVFAPSDDAFLFMPDDEFEGLLADPDALRDFLSAHIVEGAYRAEDLLATEGLVALNGETIRIQPGDRGPLVNEAMVLAEATASNGVLHIVSMVLGDRADAAPPS